MAARSKWFTQTAPRSPWSYSRRTCLDRAASSMSIRSTKTPRVPVASRSSSCSTAWQPVRSPVFAWYHLSARELFREIASNLLVLSRRLCRTSAQRSAGGVEMYGVGGSGCGIALIGDFGRHPSVKEAAEDFVVAFNHLSSGLKAGVTAASEFFMLPHRSQRKVELASGPADEQGLAALSWTRQRTAANARLSRLVSLEQTESDLAEIAAIRAKHAPRPNPLADRQQAEARQAHTATISLVLLSINFTL